MQPSTDGIPTAILQRLATRRVVLLLVAGFLFINLAIFPLVFGRDRMPLDVLVFYGPEKAYEVIAGYDERFRVVYALVATTVDFVYPIIYGLLLGLAIDYLFRRRRPEPSRLRHLRLLPLAAIALDWLENLGIVAMLLRYPERLPLVARCTGVVSGIKYLLILVSVGAVVAGGLKWLHRPAGRLD